MSQNSGSFLLLTYAEIRAIIALAKLGLLKQITPLLEYQRYIQTVITTKRKYSSRAIY